MILSVFLAIGETWEDFRSKGQDRLLINNNFKYYSSNFEKVYIFSYGWRSGKLLSNVYLVGNRYRLHRFFYAFLMPFLNMKKIMESNVLRGMQLTGGLPGIISKFFFHKKLVINYGYDYRKMAIIEGKIFQAYLYNVLKKAIMPFADAIIVTTKLLKKEINFYKKNIVYIPNSIDIQVFKPEKIRKTVDILFVGRLEKQKNLQLLMNAVALLNNQKISVLFVGNGSEKENILRFIKHHCVNLKILSSLPNNELPKYYNQAKIFILPSAIEGHPKALLEAMSCGMTVIGSKVSGIQGIIKNHSNGMLTTDNPHDLAGLIKSLLANPKLRQKLGNRARQSIKTHFNSRIIWQKEIDLLKKLSN